MGRTSSADIPQGSRVSEWGFSEKEAVKLLPTPLGFQWVIKLEGGRKGEKKSREGKSPWGKERIRRKSREEDTTLGCRASTLKRGAMPGGGGRRQGGIKKKSSK